MPQKGYKQSENHKKQLSFKAKLRGNNGWLGRRHRVDAREKMRIAAKQRWLKRRPSSYVAPIPKAEPPRPVVYEPYRDIFMDVEGWDGIKDIL